MSDRLLIFALGIAKAKRRPVAILCTSGTAAANYWPAVSEAFHSRVPLLILTADRPHELRDVGAPQAMNQLNLFGSFTKEFIEMALPEASERMYQYVRTTTARAMAVMNGAPSGPVHMNFSASGAAYSEFLSAKPLGRREGWARESVYICYVWEFSPSTLPCGIAK
ncbi:hypothetical protein GCM10020331_029900 [Ectobacillus funiculus]